MPRAKREKFDPEKFHVKPPEPSPAPPLEPGPIGELKSLVARAQQGDVTLLPRIRQILDEHVEIWQRLGDLDRLVVRSWAELLGGANPVAIESIQRQAKQLRTELEGEHPTPLEKLLVANVVAHWLELSHGQLSEADPGSRTGDQLAQRLKRLESAEKRYLAAMKTLATARALLPRGVLPTNPLKLFDPEQKMASA
jgi:hypothetical protein